MTHPFEKIDSKRRLPVFLAVLALSLTLTVLFRVLDRALQNQTAAPRGILSFEFAKDTTEAQAILDSWNEAAKLDAAFGLGIDYLYMFAYSTAISFACAWIALVLGERGYRRFAFAGFLIGWSAWIAALFDAVENYALIQMMLHGVADPFPQLSRFCATIKFGLVFIGLIYEIVGVILLVSSKSSVRQKKLAAG